MDIKAQISKLTDAVTKDPALLEQFQKEPVKAVEKVLGVELPEEAISQIIAGVKGKITADKIGNIADSLKKLF